MDETLYIMRLLNQVYLTNELSRLIERFLHVDID